MMRSARSRTRSISCSITMTVRVRGIAAISAGKRQSDFELALAAVAELANRGVAHIGQPDLGRDRIGLSVQHGIAVHWPPEYPRRSRLQRAGERQVLAHGEIREQIV